MMLIMAIYLFTEQKPLFASLWVVMALMALTLWKPRQSPPTTRNDTFDTQNDYSRNPTPEEVLEYRKTHPGTSLLEAVRALRS